MIHVFYTDQGDRPIFCTSKDELGLCQVELLVRGTNSHDESRVAGIQSLQSSSRWTAKIRFSLWKMSQSSFFPTSGVIKLLVGSYVNIAEFIDIICCCLSVTQFTMVFGKFFAFFQPPKTKATVCIYKCLKGQKRSYIIHIRENFLFEQIQ